MFDSIIKELSYYQNTDKNEILRKAIKERLNKSLEVYYKELIQSFNSLEYKNPFNIMKKVNKDV